MRDAASPPYPREPRASKLRWGLFLLGIALAVNLVDLASRCSAAGAVTTPFETCLLIAQTAVCGLLFLLMLLAAFCPGGRVGRMAAPVYFQARYEPAPSVPVEVSY